MRLRLRSFEKLALGAWAFGALLAAGMAAGLFSLGALERMPLCLFRGLTGIPCPGCGMGHAILLAWQGRWAESFSHHPLGILLWALWSLWILHGLWNAARGREFSYGFPQLRGTLTGSAAIAGILLIRLLRLGSG